MTQQASFTKAAVRDCRRYGVDDDEARDVLDNPERTRAEPDPGDPATVFNYSLGRLPDGRWLEVTWERLSDRRRVRRVLVLEDWSG